MALTYLSSLLLLLAPILAAAQPALNLTILCVPGQCLQGFSSITLGATLSSPASPVPLHLIPGQYTSTTNPLLLHNALVSSSSTLTPSVGLGNGSLALPLDLSLEPGLAVFSESLYAGQVAFMNLPNSPPNLNSSTPFAANSWMISSDSVLITTASSTRVILWDSVPDTSNLPTPLNSAQFSLLDIQSTICAPACSSGGVCNPQDGQCVCLNGFTGQSCEQCATGRFGPTCQQCPSNCTKCDDGISGTGRCLQSSSGGNTCNCLNGVCAPNGSCQCTTGFVNASNGTQCAQCASGFFLTSTGDCKVCEVGCSQCVDVTGVCTACLPGYSQDQSDFTKCDPVPQITSTGTQCPPLGFASGTSCQPCSSACETCSGATSNNCTACPELSYMLNGVCVTANSDGICDGTNLIADNNKKACDSCGAKCTSCKIPNFDIASFASQLQCTGCVTGTVLFNNTCVDACPSGTFVSPQDNSTCLPCDSSCSSCTGSATFCLTCSSQNQLAFNGQCIAASSCPKNTFANPSTFSCLTCHPDCESCSGSSFNQCTTCPPNRPVLSSGRCLSTCSKNQFWDSSSNSCSSCDSTCGSCSSSGASSCLSCTDANSLVLRSGSCVASSAACTSNNITTVVNPLGVCLNELISVPQPSQTSTLPPIPTVTGIDQPVVVTTRGPKLQWWEILLMALGGAFIVVIFMWCCCRRMKKKREKKLFRMQANVFDGLYLSTRSQDRKHWNWLLGEKIFGHSKSTNTNIPSSSDTMEPEPPAYVGEPNLPESQHKGVVKYESHFHHSRSSHSHSRSHSAANSSFIATPPRNPDDVERHSSGQPRINSPSAIRPTRPNDEQLLDLDIDAHSAEGHLHRQRSSSRQDSAIRPRRKMTQSDDEEEPDMDEIITSYQDFIMPPATRYTHYGSRSTSSNNRTTHLPVQPLPRAYRDHSHERSLGESRNWPFQEHDEDHRRSQSSISESMYSQATGRTRRVPDVRQPVRDVDLQTSRFSASTLGRGA